LGTRDITLAKSRLGANSVEDLGQVSCLVAVLGMSDGEILGVMYIILLASWLIVADMAPHRG
jgi:hypothetical protein